MQKTKQAFFIVVALLTMWSCSQKNSGNNTTATTYSMVNGMCYESTTGAQVQTALCGNSGYQMLNGMCYQSINGQLIQVQTNLCTNSNSGYQVINGQCYQMINGQPILASPTLCTNSNGLVGQQCTGIYYQQVAPQAGAQYYQGAYYQQVNCTPSYCSGHTLLTAQLQQVMCQ